MTRQPFETRRIYLRSPAQLQTAVAALQHAPLDDKKPLEVLIREAVKVRGLDQNGLYWLRLTEIADQAWFSGKKYSKDVWHIYAGRNIMPDEITTKDGEIRSKWVEVPGGGEAIISTTLLERRCFSAFITAVEAFGADLGVQFSANPRGEK